MKLLYCSWCGDVQKLRSTPTYCACGMSVGMYLPDGLNAVYGGKECLPIGISNKSLATKHGGYEPCRTADENGLGVKLEAFVVPSTAPTITEYRTTDEALVEWVNMKAKE